MRKVELLSLATSFEALCASGVKKSMQKTESFTKRYEARKRTFIKEKVRKDCPINFCIYAAGKKNGALCKGERKCRLCDRKNYAYPILTDEDCRRHLLSPSASNKIQKITEHQKAGVHSFLLVFTIESGDQCRQILEEVKKSFPKGF